MRGRGRGADGTEERGPGPLLGVVGARGGAGASILAAVLARDLLRRGGRPVVLVDGAGASAGIDVGLGIEEVAGVRWPDLLGVRGVVPGEDLRALLPRWGGVHVLSADRARPCVVPQEVERSVLGGLCPGAQVVLDLPRDGERTVALARTCARLIVVVPRDVVAVAGARVLLDQIDHPAPGLVVRGPSPGGVGVREVFRELRVEVLHSMRSDRSIAAAIDRGCGPASRRLERAARSVLDGIGFGDGDGDGDGFGGDMLAGDGAGARKAAR